MKTRNERRVLRNAFGRRVLDHPVTKRIHRNLKIAGEAATEVYRLQGSTRDQHLYFDVYSMRSWATIHAEQVVSTLCWERVKRLIATGAVDIDRIASHTLKQQMDPIIIGVDAAGPQDDQILDGAHRFVAYALSAQEAGLAGVPLPLPAYLLQPDEWRQFLIPHFIAHAFKFDALYND